MDIDEQASAPGESRVPIQPQGVAMNVGERRTLPLAARLRWNDTGLDLLLGATYQLVATGSWVDCRTVSGPEGYPSPNVLLRIAEWARAVPAEPWFALIGGLDRDRRTDFAVGRGCDYAPPRSGRLTCFANDVPLMYFNNSGQIQLTVERTG